MTKATKDEIAAVVAQHCKPRRILGIEYERDFGSGIMPTASRTSIGPAHLRGHIDGPYLWTVEPDKLTDALAELDIERRSEENKVSTLRQPAARLRQELSQRAKSTWDSRVQISCGAKIARLDAFLAGLDMRYPADLREELEAIAQRVERERDPDWEEYRKLHRKFGGDRP